MGLAATPDQLLDRINLLLMAGEMDSTLQSQIVSAVNSIPIPSTNQNAINTALLARVETAQSTSRWRHHPTVAQFPNGAHDERTAEQTRRQFSQECLSCLDGRYGRSVCILVGAQLRRCDGAAECFPPTTARWSVSFFPGGNDGHGTVIATDSTSFNAFTTARSGAPGLAYNLSDLLPITLNTPQSGRTFALNPYLTGVQNLFNAGRAAVISNVGHADCSHHLKAQIQANSVPLPASLYSHFDQTAAWQAITAIDAAAQSHTGWGGAASGP